MAWHLPMGYRIVNGKIVTDEETAKTVRSIFDDYITGKSLMAIAEALRNSGIRNSKGNIVWTHGTVGRILANGNYVGNEYYPQLIDAGIFTQAQTIRNEKQILLKRGTEQRMHHIREVFDGKIICGCCQTAYRRLTKHRYTKKGKQILPSKWKCPSDAYQLKERCWNGFYTDQNIMDVCTGAVNQLITNPELMRTMDEKKRISRELMKTENRIMSGDVTDREEMTGLLYTRAEERYLTLSVCDAAIRSEQMKEILKGRKELEEFDEELFKKLVKQLVVYPGNTIKVVFHNMCSVNFGCREES